MRKHQQVICIITIEGFDGDEYLFLLEYNKLTRGERESFHKDCFAEIMSTYELESELHEIFAI